MALIPRLPRVADYLDYVSNRVVPDYAVREAPEKLSSAAAFMSTDTTEERHRQSAEALDRAGRRAG